MGVAQNSMLALLGTAGVAASKVSGAIKGDEQPISEANDASKNELMAQKAQMNALKMKNLQLRNRQLRLQNRALKKEVNK